MAVAIAIATANAKMPHRFPFAGHGENDSRDIEEEGELVLGEQSIGRERKGSLLGRLQPFQRFQRIQGWLRREGDGEGMGDEEDLVEEPCQEPERIDEEQKAPDEDLQLPPKRPGHMRRLSRRVIPELPRPQTFRRQNSEKRERLEPVEQKRAVSEDRRPISSTKRLPSPPPAPLPRLSAPEAGTPPLPSALGFWRDRWGRNPNGSEDADGQPDEPLSDPPPIDGDERIFLQSGEDDDDDSIDPRELQEELDAKWILNLSMHFRDKSQREKFFVTYAQEPNKWRRVTVSCDYRNAQPDSLEADLKSLRYQRDKSERIYKAIRDSLTEIQFYPTVTNLKLETDDERLHVHVTEDVNEIIKYPSIGLVEHVICPRYCEKDVVFESHLSGFVYRVRAGGAIFIKKEIPGPDTVDEFLYEINALDALRGSESVIEFHGLVVDDEELLVKGLLISFASQGALVDLLYDYKGTPEMPWSKRLKWAYQTVQGLSEIHEAGFVQGDFTLSNIVVDEHDHAKIIDINRRGCPVGWEPPELQRLIESGQRIGMVIGVKSDLFQLGMVLWALGESCDEPEREMRPLAQITDPKVPAWYQRVVDHCLSDRPQNRLSARKLLAMFDANMPSSSSPESPAQDFRSEIPEIKFSDHSFDGSATVSLSDIEEEKRRRRVTYAESDRDHAPSTSYRYDSSGSYIIGQRGRSPRLDARSRRRSSPYAIPLSSRTSLSSSSDREAGERWKPVCVDDDDARDAAGDGNDDPAAERLRVRDVDRQRMPPPPLPLSGKGVTLRAHDEAERPPYSPAMFDAAGIQELTGQSSDACAAETEHPLRRQEGVYFSPPLHQDSVFDEQVIESLDFAEHSPPHPQPEEIGLPAMEPGTESAGDRDIDTVTREPGPEPTTPKPYSSALPTPEGPSSQAPPLPAQATEELPSKPIEPTEPVPSQDETKGPKTATNRNEITTYDE
ncbi:hypothetical protein M8818_002914 [Zalaria obscura]|uniref:Uncharacterized protein n=1 Tax=Zalaria obscura TaxID=2024903 RepID=A0ACC3SI91_9PEZI